MQSTRFKTDVSFYCSTFPSAPPPLLLVPLEAWLNLPSHSLVPPPHCPHLRTQRLRLSFPPPFFTLLSQLTSLTAVTPQDTHQPLPTGRFVTPGMGPSHPSAPLPPRPPSLFSSPRSGTGIRERKRKGKGNIHLSKQINSRVKNKAHRLSVQRFYESGHWKN